MGYGRTSAANGDVFSHVFNYPANYWDAASVIVNQLLEENDGDLSGKTIALLYHNSAYGGSRSARWRRCRKCTASS
jgi:branched-chain amino acid transport system substrate-binding protein